MLIVKKLLRKVSGTRQKTIAVSTGASCAVYGDASKLIKIEFSFVSESEDEKEDYRLVLTSSEAERLVKDIQGFLVKTK